MARCRTIMAGLGEPLERFLALFCVAALTIAGTKAEARECLREAPPGASHFEVGEPIESVALSGGFAYAVTFYFEFSGWGGAIYRVNFDVLDLTESVQKASVPILESPCVEVDRGFAYLGGSDFRILNVSDAAAPHVVGSRPAPSYVRDIAALGTHAYLADESGLTIMDVSDPTSPTPIGSVAIASARSVAVKGAFAYVAGDAGVTIVNVSDPASPWVVGNCAVPGSAWDIALRGAHAYVVDRSGLRVVDVARPSGPRLIGEMVGLGDAGAIAVSGARAYVADWGDATHGTSLRIVDISDPAHPVIVNSVAGQVTNQSYWNVYQRIERVSAASGRVATGGGITHMWLGDCIAGLFGCDYVTGYLDVTPASAYEPCTVSDGRAAPSWSVSERASGISDPAAFALRGNDPNPFNPETTIRFDVPRTSRVRIRVFDTKGSLVETLVDGLVDRGPHQVSWRGRTDRDQAVASGIYVVTMEAEGFRGARKITLLK